MASALATQPAEIDLFDVRCANGHETPIDKGRALVDGMCRSIGLYFGQMEITTIMHHRPAGNQCTVSAEGRLPVTLRRR